MYSSQDACRHPNADINEDSTFPYAYLDIVAVLIVKRIHQSRREVGRVIWPPYVRVKIQRESYPDAGVDSSK